MGLTGITSVEELQVHLRAAMQLEHATIPPYLTALYSIHPGTNTHAYQALRVVLVEEMLHLTLAANLLNAVGGTPDLMAPDFVPAFPAYLPDGETDFEVGLRRFSKEQLQAFLKIERPGRAPSEEARLVKRTRPRQGIIPAAHVAADHELHFFSIGEFYEDIARALPRLEEEKQKQGGTLFVGDPKRQITPEYYYSGGGELLAVTNLATAKEAIRLIAEQGEGIGGAIYDYENEISHYYRFQQLMLGRFYQKGDKPDAPTGLPLEVDWDAVYPIKPNARVADYASHPEMRAAAEDFNTVYRNFLQLLTRAFNGEPQLLYPAIGDMFRIKELASQLMRNPLRGDSEETGAPTFEMSAVTTPAV